MEDIEAVTQRFQPFAFDMRWASLSPELIEECHKRGIKVFSDGLGRNESLEEYTKAIEWGIDLIQTDNPILLQRAIEVSVQ
jgi:glycerophosphoryl diester phosphodiesterase